MAMRRQLDQFLVIPPLGLSLSPSHHKPNTESSVGFPKLIQFRSALMMDCTRVYFLKLIIHVNTELTNHLFEGIGLAQA